MTNLDIFRKSFEEHGYTLHRDKKGAQHDRALHYASLFEEALNNWAILRILMNAKVRKGEAYTYQELYQMGHPKGDGERFSRAIEEMIMYHMMRRGYRIECPICYLQYWYTTAEITDPYKCVGCQSIHVFPADLRFSYVLNPLWAAVINNGGLTVLLARVYLCTRQDGSACFATSGFFAQKQKQSIEVDLMITEGRNSRWLLECKDEIHSTAKLVEQLTKLIQLATDVGGTPCFATLAETIPPEILTFCEQNNVRVLTRAELVRE